MIFWSINAVLYFRPFNSNAVCAPFSFAKWFIKHFWVSSVKTIIFIDKNLYQVKIYNPFAVVLTRFTPNVLVPSFRMKKAWASNIRNEKSDYIDRIFRKHCILLTQNMRTHDFIASVSYFLWYFFLLLVVE